MRKRIGNNMRRIMKAKKCTYKALSEKSGVPMSTLSNIALGKSLPRVETLYRISQALDITIDYLVNNETDQYPLLVDEEFFQIYSQLNSDEIKFMLDCAQIARAYKQEYA